MSGSRVRARAASVRREISLRIARKAAARLRSIDSPSSQPMDLCISSTMPAALPDGHGPEGWLGRAARRPRTGERCVA